MSEQISDNFPENIDNCMRFCPLAIHPSIVKDGRRKAIRRSVQLHCPGPIVTECLTYEADEGSDKGIDRTITHDCGAQPLIESTDVTINEAYGLIDSQHSDVRTVARVIPQGELRSHDNWDAYYLMRYGIN